MLARVIAQPPYFPSASNIFTKTPLKPVKNHGPANPAGCRSPPGPPFSLPLGTNVLFDFYSIFAPPPSGDQFSIHFLSIFAPDTNFLFIFKAFFNLPPHRPHLGSTSRHLDPTYRHLVFNFASLARSWLPSQPNLMPSWLQLGLLDPILAPLGIISAQLVAILTHFSAILA